MCGRFTQYYTWWQIWEMYHLFPSAPNLQPRYNIGPTMTIDTVISRNGKRELFPRGGRKDRFAMLSRTLLELLRDWYRIARPAVWLCPGHDPMLPMTTRQFNRAVHAAAADMAEVKKRVPAHAHAVIE